MVNDYHMIINIISMSDIYIQVKQKIFYLSVFILKT